MDTPSVKKFQKTIKKKRSLVSIKPDSRMRELLPVTLSHYLESQVRPLLTGLVKQLEPGSSERGTAHKSLQREKERKLSLQESAVEILIKKEEELSENIHYMSVWEQLYYSYLLRCLGDMTIGLKGSLEQLACSFEVQATVGLLLDIGPKKEHYSADVLAVVTHALGTLVLLNELVKIDNPLVAEVFQNLDSQLQPETSSSPDDDGQILTHGMLKSTAVKIAMHFTTTLCQEITEEYSSLDSKDKTIPTDSKKEESFPPRIMGGVHISNEESLGSVPEKKLKLSLEKKQKSSKVRFTSSGSREDRDSGSESGMTPLHIAAHSGRYELLMCLLEEGRSALLKYKDKLKLVEESGDEQKLTVSEEQIQISTTHVSSITGEIMSFLYQSSSTHLRTQGTSDLRFAGVPSKDVGTALPLEYIPRPEPQPSPQSEMTWCWQRRLESVPSVPSYVVSENESDLKKLDTQCQETVFHAIASVSVPAPVSVIQHLSKRLSPNLLSVQDKHGNTPLHNAVLSRKVEVACELVNLCPSVVLVLNYDRQTPLDMAIRCGLDPVVEQLLTVCVKSDPHKHNTIQMLQSFLFKGVDVGYYGYIEILLKLCEEFGLAIDFECSDGEGYTAWHHLSHAPLDVRTDVANMLRASNLKKPVLNRILMILLADVSVLPFDDTQDVDTTNPTPTPSVETSSVDDTLPAYRVDCVRLKSKCPSIIPHSRDEDMTDVYSIMSQKYMESDGCEQPLHNEQAEPHSIDEDITDVDSVSKKENGYEQPLHDEADINSINSEASDLGLANITCQDGEQRGRSLPETHASDNGSVLPDVHSDEAGSSTYPSLGVDLSGVHCGDSDKEDEEEEHQSIEPWTPKKKQLRAFPSLSRMDTTNPTPSPSDEEEEHHSIDLWTNAEKEQLRAFPSLSRMESTCSESQPDEDGGEADYAYETKEDGQMSDEHEEPNVVEELLETMIKLYSKKQKTMPQYDSQPTSSSTTTGDSSDSPPTGLIDSPTPEYSRDKKDRQTSDGQTSDEHEDPNSKRVIEELLADMTKLNKKISDLEAKPQCDSQPTYLSSSTTRDYSDTPPTSLIDPPTLESEFTSLEEDKENKPQPLRYQQRDTDSVTPSHDESEPHFELSIPRSRKEQRKRAKSRIYKYRVLTTSGSDGGKQQLKRRPLRSRQSLRRRHNSGSHSEYDTTADDSSDSAVVATAIEAEDRPLPSEPAREPARRIGTQEARTIAPSELFRVSLLDRLTVPEDHKMVVQSLSELLHAQDYNRILQLAFEGEPPTNLPLEAGIPYVFITGLAYYKLSNHKKSVQHFTRCLRMADEAGRDGDITICNIYIGDIEFAKRKYSEAAGRYRTALQHYSRHSVAQEFKMVMPTQSAVWLKSGSAFKNASRVGDSVSAYEKAIELATTNSSKKDQLSARTSLGNLYQGIGENGRAVKEYEEAIKLAEELGDHVSLGWNHGNLGNALLGLHLRDKALYHLDLALDVAVQYEMTPQAIGRAYNNLGTAFQSLNELSKSEEQYDLALAQAIYGNDIPGQARVHANIGNLQMLNKRYERAVPHYTEAMRLSQDKTTITTAHHNRGCAYYDWAVKKMNDDRTTQRGRTTAIEIKGGNKHSSNSSSSSSSSSNQTNTSNGHFTVSLHGPNFEDCEEVYRPRKVKEAIQKYYLQGTRDLEYVIKHHEESFNGVKGSPKGLSLSVSLFETNSRTFHRMQDCHVHLTKNGDDPAIKRKINPPTKFEDALVVAEQSRARTLGELMLKRRGGQLMHELVSPPTLDQMKTIVGRQTCPVVYLSYTGERVLGWLLYPSPKGGASVNMFEIPLSDNEFDGKSLDYHLRYALNEQLVEKSFEMYKPFDHEKDKTEPLEKLYDLVARPIMLMLQTIEKKQEGQKTEKDEVKYPYRSSLRSSLDTERGGVGRLVHVLDPTQYDPSLAGITEVANGNVVEPILCSCDSYSSPVSESGTDTGEIQMVGRCQPQSKTLEEEYNISVQLNCVYKLNMLIETASVSNSGIESNSRSGVIKELRERLSDISNERLRNVSLIVDSEIYYTSIPQIVDIQAHLIESYYFQIIPKEIKPHHIKLEDFTDENLLFVGVQNIEPVTVNNKKYVFPENESIPDEIRSIKSHFPSCKPLLGEDATKEALINRLKSAKLVHISTHAVEEGLVFPNRQILTPEDIRSQQKISALLVILSCCGRKDPEIAKAFLDIKAHAVIAVHGRIGDDHARHFTECFYTNFIKKRRSAALSMHDALQAMNSLKDSSPPYLYHGGNLSLM